MHGPQRLKRLTRDGSTIFLFVTMKLNILLMLLLVLRKAYCKHKDDMECDVILCFVECDATVYFTVLIEMYHTVVLSKGRR